MHHRGLELHRLAVAGKLQRIQAGFILVAQRQMQGQIPVAGQPQFAHRLLGRRKGSGLRGGHAAIIGRDSRSLSGGQPPVVVLHKCFDIRSRHGPRKHIPLQHVAPKILKKLCMLQGFHPFGHHLDVQCLGHVDHG